MRAIKAAVVTLIISVMLLGIGTSLRLMLLPEKANQSMAWKQTNQTTWTDRDERSLLERASRASSERTVIAPVDTTTTTEMAPPSTQKPKLISPTTTAQRTVPQGDVWTALAFCESGGNPNSRSANGLYTGAFQFADATWQSLGYSGEAADHSYETQLEGAKRLQQRSGWGQWPRCSRRLGLR